MELILGLLALVLATIAVVGPIVALILVIVLWRRVGSLERRLRVWEAGPGPAVAEPVRLADEAKQPDLSAEFVLAESVDQTALSPPMPKPSKINWEELIGRKALGWVAVVLLLFAATFFLRYAYENGWIGPQGRVGVGVLAGLALMIAGWRYHCRGWRIFSQMMSSAGVVVLFLSVYSSFGFYRLVPQQIASIFMLAVIVEAALIAVLYRSAALAWMSLLGGLLTPVLMSSEIDQYQSFFAYLVALNVGVIVLGRLKSWSGLGTAALLGAHLLFWMWYDRWYHPEKFAWAIGFQLAIYAIFVLLDVTRTIARRQAGWEDLARLLINAFLWFTAAFILLRTDYREWLGLAAVGMAAVYVVLARLAFIPKTTDQRQLLTALAAAVGFVALAFPIQADAEWVALGWAAEAAALWWFGLRIGSPVLRSMAAALMTLTVGRLLFFDILAQNWMPAVPIFNHFAMPALGVVLCLFAALLGTRRYREALSKVEQVLIAMGAVGGVLLLWLILTVDLSGYFKVRASEQMADVVRWRWFSQLAISALWAVYAVFILAIGFRRRVAWLRWTALLIFGLTTGKVLLWDMSGLEEVYRILAFFVVAMVLGLAGWAYQRIQVGTQSQTSEADSNVTTE